MRQGLFNMSAEEYRAAEGISNSYLKKLSRCPANVKVETPSTPEMIFGRIAHSIILENDYSGYVAIPNLDRRTKEGKAQYADFLQSAHGREIVSEEDLDKIKGMKTSILSHPSAARLLAQGVSEVSAFWIEPKTGLQCKCRPDRVPSNGAGTLIDLKTAADASESAFTNTCARLGYAQQAAYYLDGMSMATESIYDIFAFIVVEKVEPYRVEVYTLSPDFIEYGRMEYQRLLRLEKTCRESGYPAYESKEPRELVLPGYLRNKMEAIS